MAKIILVFLVTASGSSVLAVNTGLRTGLEPALDWFYCRVLSKVPDRSGHNTEIVPGACLSIGSVKDWDEKFQRAQSKCREYGKDGNPIISPVFNPKSNIVNERYLCECARVWKDDPGVKDLILKKC